MKVKSVFASDLPESEFQEFSIDLSGMDAWMDNGMLHLALPRGPAIDFSQMGEQLEGMDFSQREIADVFDTTMRKIRAVQFGKLIAERMVD